MRGASPARSVLRVVEHHFMVYRRTWRGTVVSTFFNPVLFLGAMGVALHALLEAVERAGLKRWRGR